MHPSDEQEVWITIRLKGYARCDANLETLALSVAERATLAENALGLFPVTAHDVIEVEEEAAIYGSE